MLNYESIKAIDFQTLIRTDLSSSLRFDGIINYAKSMASDFLSFEGREEGLLDTEKDIISIFFSKYSELITRIRDFKSEDAESSARTLERKRELVQEFRNTHTSFIKEALPILLKIKLSEKEKDFEAKIDGFSEKIKTSEELLNQKITNFDTNLSTSLTTFRNTLNQSQNDFNQKIKDAQSELQEAKKIKQEAKDLTISKLVEKYGAIFLDQANKNFKYAQRSLGAFIISLILTVGLILYFFIPLINRIYDPSEQIFQPTENQMTASSSIPNTKNNRIPDQVSLEYVIAYLVSRLTILLVVSIVVRESLKNYNANMHLYNLNLHRQNALQSFDILISNTDHKDTRDHVIKELAQTIYANQDNGYLSTDKKQMSLGEITDIIKAIRGV